MKPVSNNRYKEFEVSYAKRYLSSRAQRLLGVPEREEMISKDDTLDGYHLCMCPNSRVITQFHKAAGKRVKIIVPCGRCMYCRHKYQNQLIYRMYIHNKFYKHAIFITLTYAPSHYLDNVDVCRHDITKFLKRLRKHLDDKTLSYYQVCERGDEKNRLHFHLILWWNGYASTTFMYDLCKTCWSGPIRNFTALPKEAFTFHDECDYNTSLPMGFVTLDAVKESQSDDMNSYIFSYVSKYVTGKEKKLMFRSWSLGLGADILSTDEDLLKKFSYLNIIAYRPKDKTYHISLPKYYKNKLFSQSERDCFFLDYLCSNEFEKRLDFLDDPVKMHNLMQVYKDYEARTLEAYKARKKSKRKKPKSQEVWYDSIE